MTKKIKVFQIRFDNDTKKVQERVDVTERFKGQYIGLKEIVSELRFKKEALEGKQGNVYYEVIGIDYSSLNIPDELKSYIPATNTTQKDFKDSIENILWNKLKIAGYKVNQYNNDTAIGIKEYKCSLGNRNAEVYLSKGDKYNRTISCNFFSERNHRHSALLPLNADSGELAKIIDTFIAESEQMIQQSYAMRLSEISSQYNESTHGNLSDLMNQNTSRELKC